MTEDPFQRVVDSLDIEGVIVTASARNDLLPPRAEDNVGGEVGKRFTEGLKRKIECGRYEPDRAAIAYVPKPSHTTRPAAIMTLEDRVVYEALVDALRPRMEKTLLGPDIIFWPRGHATDKRWIEFENASLAHCPEYVVLADITGFYESIDHEMLGDVLVRATGKRELVEALTELLRRTLGSTRGLPQGLGASDALATAYLSPVDASVVGAGFNYYRHGDDVRIGVNGYSKAREAVFVFERELRTVGLLLSAEKSRIMKRTTYQHILSTAQDAFAAIRQKFIDEKAKALSEDDDKLIDAMQKAGLDDEIGWELFYHGTKSIDEVIELLRPHLEPLDEQVAAKLFIATIDKVLEPRHGLAHEIFHQRLSFALIRLTAMKSTAVLAEIGTLLLRFPDKTELLCTYLLSLASTDEASVSTQIEQVVTTESFKTDWQWAWIMRVCQACSGSLSPEATDVVTSVAQDEAEGWLARIEAAKVLASNGQLDESLLRRMSNTLPAPCRADVIAAAHAMREHSSWAGPFLAGYQNDAIGRVVLSHLSN